MPPTCSQCIHASCNHLHQCTRYSTQTQISKGWSQEGHALFNMVHLCQELLNKNFSSYAISNLWPSKTSDLKPLNPSSRRLKPQYQDLTEGFDSQHESQLFLVCSQFQDHTKAILETESGFIEYFVFGIANVHTSQVLQTNKCLSLLTQSPTFYTKCQQSRNDNYLHLLFSSSSHPHISKVCKLLSTVIAIQMRLGCHLR